MVNLISENMDGLIQLSLESNRFNETIPESLSGLSKLRLLDVAANSFIGTLTEHHFANLTNLLYMGLSCNSLQLNVTKDWVPSFHADTILMYSCTISPDFPAWLKTQTVLASLYLSSARIFGNVPTWFWNLLSNSLALLNLSHNNLTGILPIFWNSVLEVIDLSHNKFEGLIPEWISPGLNIIDLRNNSLFGHIPLSFATANQIQALSLSHEHINGSIQFFFFCNLSTLIVLDLSSNNMSGELPHCWNQLSWLAIIDLSNNNFFGNIPNAIVSLTNLQSLHLRKNDLSGNLPFSLKNANKLVVLHVNTRTRHPNFSIIAVVGKD
ncbi:receptor-like protein EIX2 [Dioscorea cayenensis subsp. rotundata]|uniref:Receptor-like protein EIX2 n=1 Tax=Dioscorea cayennensis subsp. rotundata TaxID=55577 RepID=A0AB40C759_DIOCR|nr:receptor-like protein EIX2 [Dioscorea cayenensis subsp. rotundata]